MADAQPMTEAMYYILLALLNPCHGYGMMARIKEISVGRMDMGPGTLYGVLSRMKKDGLIELESHADRRKTYVITQKGKQALVMEYKRLQALVRDGASLGEEQ